MERASVNTIRQTRLGRGWALVGGVALLGMGMVASPARAADPPPSGAAAVVGGNATAPNIECAWALNDSDKSWTGTPKMQYGFDDTPSTTPGSPCQASGEEAAMPNPFTTPMIHVKPNAHDEPTEQFVELWGAVDSGDDNLSAFFDVFHPDGSKKTQVDATRYAYQGTPTRCTGPTGMFAAAVNNGEMTSVAASNIQIECATQSKQLWYGAFGISKHQPWGLYRVTFRASVGGGVESTQTFYIYVQPFSNLEKDFTTVNFGNVNSNTHIQTTTGNFTFDGANLSGNQQYSVRNTGNAGIALGVRFASLCRNSFPDGATECTSSKRIDHFDAKFGVGDSTNLQSLGNVSYATAITSDLAATSKPAPLGTEAQFDDSYGRTLCPNDVGKMEFSIWTATIPGDTYSALNGIQLVGRANPKCITDNYEGHLGAPYVANRGLPQFGNPITPISNSHWPA